MNHRLKVQAHFSLVALQSAREERVELCAAIAETFANLSPEVVAAALNAATAARTARDYMAVLENALRLTLGAPDSDPAATMMQQVPDGITQDATGPAETHTMEDACQMAWTQYADGRAGRGLCALEYHEFRGVWSVAMQLRLSADEAQERLRLAESRLCAL